MTDLVADSIVTHVYTIYIFFSVMVFNMLTVLVKKDFVKLAKQLRFMTPIFHFLNAVVIYTGSIVAAYSHDLSPTVILMIAASIFIMVAEIKRYKKMRVIKHDDIEAQFAFKLYAKKIYYIEMGTLIAVYIISKVF